MSDEAIEAINNLAIAIREYTNEMKMQNPNRLLTVEDVEREYEIGARTVYSKIFNNPNVITNKISKAKKIKNSELWKFFDIKHETL